MGRMPRCDVSYHHGWVKRIALPFQVRNPHAFNFASRTSDMCPLSLRSARRDEQIPPAAHVANPKVIKVRTTPRESVDQLHGGRGDEGR